MNRSCYGINKVLDVKPLVSLLTRSMPIVKSIIFFDLAHAIMNFKSSLFFS